MNNEVPITARAARERRGKRGLAETATAELHVGPLP
jgi:hypothetical protein